MLRTEQRSQSRSSSRSRQSSLCGTPDRSHLSMTPTRGRTPREWNSIEKHLRRMSASATPSPARRRYRTPSPSPSRAASVPARAFRSACTTPETPSSRSLAAAFAAKSDQSPLSAQLSQRLQLLAQPSPAPRRPSTDDLLEQRLHRERRELVQQIHANSVA